MYTPSRKIIFLLIACVASVSLIFFSNKKIRETSLAIVETASSTTPEDIKDTDGDGLPDWEEAIRGTNITNQDTDGDGTLDGEELKQNRNPLKKGPDDNLTATTTTAKIAESNSGALTNTFAKDLFSRYLQAQSGGVTDDQTNESISQSILDEYSSSLDLKDHFKSSDILTSSTLDNEKVHQYANDFLTTEDQGLREAAALAKDDEASLVPMGKKYQELATKLGTLIVPDALTETHIAIMNNYYRLGEVLTQVPKAKDDPLKKMLLMQKISENQTEREQLYEIMASFIKNSGIIFDNEEPGSYWVK